MKKTFLLIIILVVVSSVKAQSIKLNHNDLKHLLNLMAGEYSSEELSKKDTSFSNVTIRMKPFWKNNTNGLWLYVEQAMANAQEKPYRQRVYHLFIQDDTTIVSKVYEIRGAEKYIFAWKNEEKLKSITTDSLIDRQGCGIYLHKKSESLFAGSTPGKECLSVLRGAAYATSEVAVYADKLVTWDRGWDKDGKQVWGAVKGGYTFNKLKEFN